MELSPQQILGTIFGILFPVLLGFTIIYLILGNLLINLPMTLAVSYGIGLGVITQWMLFLLVFHSKISIWNIYIPLSIILMALLIGIRPPKRPLTAFPAELHPLKHAVFKKLLLMGAAFYIAYQLYFIFWNALELPVYSWDGIYDIAIKSKYFFYNGQLAGLRSFPGTSSYPLQVEWSLTWMALNIHAWNDQIIKIIFPLIFCSYLVIQYNFLKYLAGWRQALIGTALLCSADFVNFHATIEYRAIFLLYYNITPILLLILWHKERRDGLLLLAGLLAGFGTFTKLEADGHCVIYAVLLWFILKHLKLDPKERVQKFIKFLLPVLALFLFFFTVQRSLNLPFMEGRTVFSNNINYIDRLIQIIHKLIENLFCSNNWNILWFLLLISLIRNVRKIKECFITRILLLGLAMYLCLYIAIGLLTNAYELLFSQFNLSRTLLHFFPLVPILIILTNDDHPELIHDLSDTDLL
jgi:hypothetical protein